MIRYALRCADGHDFESWFQSADAYDALADKGLVSCAVCGSAEVSKALMAPRVVAEAAPVAAPAPDVPAAPKADGPPAPPAEMLRALRAHVEANSTHVGKRFASEARAQHLGDVPQRPIHGEANGAEVKSLLEDGVPILPLPVDPKDRAK